MAYTHGKSNLVYWGEYDWSWVFNQVQITAETETLDTTTFGQTVSTGLRSYMNGTPSGSVSLTGFYDGTRDLDPDIDSLRAADARPDETIKTWAESSTVTEKPLTIIHGGANQSANYVAADNSPVSVINTMVSSWDVSSPVNDLVAMSVDLNGISSTTTPIGGFRLKGKTIEHGYADSDNTTTTSTQLVWNGVGTAATTDWVQVSTSNDHDYGAVITIHVLDNTVDQDVAITIQHDTTAGGAPAEFGTDLLWPTSARLTSQTLGSKQVGFNPGTDNTEGYWRLTATPAAAANGELAVLCSVSILEHQLFT